MKKLLLILAAMVFGLGLIPASAQNYNFNIGGLQYASGPSVPGSCSRAGSWFYKNTSTRSWNICNGSTYDAVSTGGSSSGTVTSVGFTGGLLSVGTPTTTPAFTVAGTSGGIPFFSSTSTWASSALLAAGGLVLGGGSGTTPATSTQLTFSAPTLTVGLAGTSSGILALTGSTSGSATFTAPATAGTVTNPVVSSNVIQGPAGGTAAAPTFQLGTLGTGLYGTNTINFSLSGTEFAQMQTNEFAFNLNMPIGWGTSVGTMDIAISRDSAGVIDVGTGAAGSKAGTLQAKAVNLTDTTAATDFTMKNTTAAVVGTSQGSPVQAQCGRAFHGSADVEDCMTFSELPGNGNDAAITFAVGHTGTSTGAVTTTFPGAISLPSGANYVLNGMFMAAGSATTVSFGNAAVSNNARISAAAYTSAGTKFTASGCSNGTTLGGASAGSFLTGASGTCAVTITIGSAASAPTGWSCWASDATTAAGNPITQTGVAVQTTATLTLPAGNVSGDLIRFACMAY